MPPNVLCIVFDTARADAFEPYGAGTGASPTVQQLAQSGTAFPRAYAPANWTVPSHASMFTGLLPRALGLGQAPGGTAAGCRPLIEAQRHRLLAEVLRKAGYSTKAVSTNLWIAEHSGFATGFDEFVSVTTERPLTLHDQRLRGRLRWATAAVRANADDGAGEAEQVLNRWLQDGPARPFFWFVNLIECHSPYLPPQPYNDLGPRVRLRAAAEARRHLTMAGIWQAAAGASFDVPADALARMRHLYGRSVRLLDDWLARVLDAMDGAGVLQDTLVVVTSDHGENLGEGNRLGHAFSLDNRLIHVPLVAMGPVPLAAPRAWSLAAFPRLVADALGLSGHPWVEDGAETGVAVAQLDALADPTHPRMLRAVEDWKLDDDSIRRMTSPATCATDGRLKLVRDNDGEQLFDLDADPLEERPRDPAHGDGAVTALRHAIDEADTAPAAPPDVDRNPADAEITGLEDRMRLLGYL